MMDGWALPALFAGMIVLAISGTLLIVASYGGLC